MFIIHVTPLSKNSIDTLSYFSTHEIPIGSIVQVPLRKKQVYALVVDREDARAIKSMLRTNVYETKKISKQKPITVISAEFVRAAQRSAQYSATSVGSIVHGYTPAAILEAAEKGEIAPTPPRTDTATTHEHLALQLPTTERFEKYKTIIRTQFAQKRSVYICVPTARDAERLTEYCTRGIEQYTFTLTSANTKKQQKETWNAALAQEHPVLIIATPTFLSLPRRDVAMYIIEREMSSAYKQQTRPYADARVLCKHLAKETKSTLVYGDTVLSLETHRALRDGSIAELEEHMRTLRGCARVEVVDSKESRMLAKEHKEEFPVISPTSLEALTECVHEKKRAFVFAPRRGLASNTVCNDCGLTVACARCGAPMVLHERRTRRELLCHRCGVARDAHERCAECDSWDLVALGIGIERVEEYLAKHLPKGTPLFVLSSDTAKTPKKAKEIATQFSQSTGGVLIGTEMALAYIDTPLHVTVLSSIDSLLSIPDFRIEEKIFSIIATLREHTKKILLVETTSPSNTMLKHAKNGALGTYLQEELSLRKQLKYPPYNTLIKVTCSGTQAGVIDAMKKFTALLKGHQVRVFHGFTKYQRNTQLHALVRVPYDAWPDEELVRILQSLPPTYTIDVSPERTL